MAAVYRPTSPTTAWRPWIMTFSFESARGRGIIRPGQHGEPFAVSSPTPLWLRSLVFSCADRPQKDKACRGWAKKGQPAGPGDTVANHGSGKRAPVLGLQSDDLEKRLPWHGGAHRLRIIILLCRAGVVKGLRGATSAIDGASSPMRPSPGISVGTTGDDLSNGHGKTKLRSTGGQGRAKT